MKKTICLTMIVKDEGHVILDTLANLTKYFTLDCYAISDTGSSDDTKAKITEYFKQKGIPGEVYDDPWKDFGHNRTRAFERAYDKSDYVLVWDADDSVVGDFKLPEQLTHDFYTFTFGPGTVYSRAQLFNNHKRWKYVGVLHEYPACCEETGPSLAVTGNYHFISGRTGNRSKNPNKYLDDAKILEKAFYDAYAAKDPIFNRYAFYTAQSYSSCGKNEQAIEFYKKVLSLENWVQEKYVACFNIYDLYEGLKREEEGLRFLVEGHKYDSRRVECIYRLIKYYCIKGQPDVAMAYYTLIQNYYEHEYLTDNLASRLFASTQEYEFYLPYYMIIVCDRVKRPDIAIKMCTMIFRKGYCAGEWWIHNLFHNLQFSIPTDNAIFVDEMLAYVYKLRREGVTLKDNQYAILDKVVAANRGALGASVGRIVHARVGPGPGPGPGPGTRVMLSITTCKRFDLFQQTMHSILRTWKDLHLVDYFFCVDDNSSEEDRAKMRRQFPFFTYYMKKGSEKGHRESMNIIWNKLHERTPTYWIHLEDDWLYLTSESYVGRGIALLDTYEHQNIHQVVFNREYGLMLKDMDNKGGTFLEKGAWLHTQDAVIGKNCAYWPHYSMQPSIMRTRVILELGNYDSPHTFFERDYADRYNAAGYKTMFFDGIYSSHIGKQHWEKEGKNAYALNETGQFTTKPKHLPLVGTMRDHLDQILQKITEGTPFGLIRPSDGEHRILNNTTLTNCDKWTFTSGGILRQHLLDAIQTVDPNLYIGIPCNTCNTPWNCTQEIYDDFTETWKVPREQRTYANIFGNANWKPFTDFLTKRTEKPIYLVTSGTQTGELHIADRLLIDETLVNRWDSEHEAATARVLGFVANKTGELVCFSAGPLSKYWIPLCMKANPTNMYVDVGASLDIFTKGATNRMYTTPTSRFAKDTCRFETWNARNLVYMCVFHNEAYLELLRILMCTIRLFSHTDTMDFLVCTSPDFQPKVQLLSEQIGIPIRTHCFPFSSFEEAGYARLHIFAYPRISQYEKILYIDTDIIVQNDLFGLFTLDIENKVYALPEGTIEHEYHGGWYFDFATIDKQTPGLNSGILLFKNTAEIKQIFHDILEHIHAVTKMPSCLDQPFINYHVIKAGRQDTSLLTKYASIYCMDPPPPPSGPTDCILCHFVWPIGNAHHKRSRMLAHMKHIFQQYSDIYQPESAPHIVDATYTWTTGYITLGSNGRLTTTWGQGTYRWMDAHTLEATWRSCSHILRFPADYKTFVSVRTSDFEIVTGRLCGPIGTVQRHTHLVYFSIFYNSKYFKLAKAFLKSLRFFSTIAFDILLLTSPDFEKEAEELCAILPIRIHYMPFTTIFQAACARLHVFDYPDIQAYQTILYLDTDILIKKDLAPLFAEPLADRLYGLGCGTISSVSFGSQFFDFTTIDGNTTGINSGTLLFRNCEVVRDLFGRINAHIAEYKDPVPYTMDQPFINFHAIRDKVSDTTLLQPYVSLYEGGEVTNYATSSICHFSFPIGNSDHKYARMEAYLRTELSRISECTDMWFVHTSYVWGCDGVITFGESNRLRTPWGDGTYACIGENRILAKWGTWEHVLQFEADHVRGLSLRIAPLDFDMTSLQSI